MERRLAVAFEIVDNEEFLLWLSGNLTVSVKMQVQSLALLSGLRIQHCFKLWQ